MIIDNIYDLTWDNVQLLPEQNSGYKFSENLGLFLQISDGAL